MKRIVKTREELLATEGVIALNLDGNLVCHLGEMYFNEIMLEFVGKELGADGMSDWSWEDWMFIGEDEEPQRIPPVIRWTFQQDQDGHWYQVPVDQLELFTELVEQEDGWEKPEWEQFEEMELGGGIESISFVDPVGLD